MDITIILTIILIVFVILELNFTRYILINSKKYYCEKDLEISELEIALTLLKEANCGAYISVLYPDNLYIFRIVKRQDSKNWWFEYQSKKQLKISKKIESREILNISPKFKAKNNKYKYNICLGIDIDKIQEFIDIIFKENYNKDKNPKLSVSFKNTKVLKSYEDIEKDFKRIN